MIIRYALNRTDRSVYLANMNKIADFVRDARHARGLTQEQLEDQIGKSGGYIGQLEGGKIKRPQNETLYALAQVLLVPIEDLLVATGQLPAPPQNAAAMIQRIAALPTPEARVRAWRELPDSLRAAMLILMRDVFQVAAQRLEELTD